MIGGLEGSMRTPLLVLIATFVSMGCMKTNDVAPDNGTDKRIALSYDDAPRGDGRVFTGAERTAELIKQWNKTGPVVIFSTTRELEANGSHDRLRDYAEAGHLIANHSDAHPWASQTEVADYLDGIDRAEARLDGLPNRRPWFRFPYLDEGGYGEDGPGLEKRDALRAGLAERRLRNGYVTIDTYDWHLDALLQTALRDGRTVDRDALGRVYADMVVEAAEHYDSMALDVLDRRPAQILLLHENDVAALFTDEAVAALRTAGWTIIDPDEAYTDPIAQIQPETRFAGKGRIAAIARDRGRSGAEYFDHWSSDEAGIEARIERERIFSD